MHRVGEVGGGGRGESNVRFVRFAHVSRVSAFGEAEGVKKKTPPLPGGFSARTKCDDDDDDDGGSGGGGGGGDGDRWGGEGNHVQAR